MESGTVVLVKEMNGCAVRRNYLTIISNDRDKWGGESA